MAHKLSPYRVTKAESQELAVQLKIHPRDKEIYQYPLEQIAYAIRKFCKSEKVTPKDLLQSKHLWSVTAWNDHLDRWVAKHPDKVNLMQLTECLNRGFMDEQTYNEWKEKKTC